jgi:hypothetical protein
MGRVVAVLWPRVETWAWPCCMATDLQRNWATGKRLRFGGLGLLRKSCNLHAQRFLPAGLTDGVLSAWWLG